MVLSVTDTGGGIAPDILERVFDPFFTTKEPGTGTGLGLSMVHGFVKQSGGHIRIYSEVGQGTTVKIYLPKFAQAASVAAMPASSELALTLPMRAKGAETVLVVEDSDAVLEFVISALEDLGYRVLSARNGLEALRVLESEEKIALLFTDIVLPGGMTGRELADRALRTRPGLPVLFTTGFSRNAIVHQGRLDANVNFLGKPYTQPEVAQRVRALGTFMAALAVTTPSHFRPSPTHTASSRAELASPQRQWGHRATAPSVSIPPGLHSG